MEDTKIDFGLDGIAELLRAKLLAVPEFQRSYSWHAVPASKSETLTLQVDEFWTDLVRAINEGVKDYFLGTVVLSKQGRTGRLEIIDGQQRLATTALLIAAIRNEFARRGDSARARIVETKYLSEADLDSGEVQPKMMLNPDDDTCFRSLVVDGVPPSNAISDRDSHALLIRAMQFFEAKLDDYLKDTGATWPAKLLALVDFVTNRVRVVRIEVPTEADAFLIFETLNDRGADLTVGDLLKNYLFGLSRERLETVKSNWSQTLGALDVTAANLDFTKFARHYWSSRYGVTRERELYARIKATTTTSPQAVELSNELVRSAKLYSAISNRDHDFWTTLGTESRANVDSLARFNLEQFRPMLLSAMQHFSPAELRLLVRFLVSWAFRGLIVGGIGAGNAERYFCLAAVKIRSGEIKTAADVGAEIAPIIPTDEEFRAAFTVARLSASKARLARYVLQALERAHHGANEPELIANPDEDEVNLEHVLPQNSTREEWGVFSDDERTDLVWRFGNLCLLRKSENAKIGNKPFTVKQPILSASSLALTTSIGSIAVWDRDAIEQRQKILADLAVSAWPRHVFSLSAP